MKIKSIEDFLGQGPFKGRGRELRNEMSNGVCLSGSQAVPYTVKVSESFSKQLRFSDWDFYTNGTVRNLQSTIQSLRRLGVEFRSIFYALSKEIETARVHYSYKEPVYLGLNTLQMLQKHWYRLGRSCIYSSVNEFFSALEKQNVDLHSSDFSEERRELPLICLSKNCTIRVAVCPRQKAMSVEDIGYRKLKLTVVTGEINGVAVQVIAKPKQPMEQLIMEFHSSFVQCFVGADYAAHFYWTMARKGKSYFWGKNDQAPKSAMAAQRKYQRRGVRYIDYNEKGLNECTGCEDKQRKRQLGDAESLSVAGPEHNERPLKWLESPGCTKLVNKRKVPLDPVKPDREFWEYVDSRPYDQYIT